MELLKIEHNELSPATIADNVRLISQIVFISSPINHVLQGQLPDGRFAQQTMFQPSATTASMIIK